MDRSRRIQPELTQLLRAEGDFLPWAVAMERALYHPQWGYYARGPVIGRSGDFYTPSQVGSVYAALFTHWLAQLHQETSLPWSYVEVGAGSGDMLAYLAQHSPARTYAVERSAAQRERLQARCPSTRVVASLEDLPDLPAVLLVACELVDAFPIHPVRNHPATGLQEAYLWYREGEWHWTWGELPPPPVQALWEQWEGDLAYPHQVEIPYAAVQWMHEASRWVAQRQAGVLLLLDYFRSSAELFLEPEGTLRGYDQHRLLRDPQVLANTLGQIDLTTTPPVDLLSRAGEQAGLQRLWQGPQGPFLLAAGCAERLPEANLDPFSPAARQRRALLQLVHPQAMGESFGVLSQVSGLDPRRGRRLLFPNSSEG